MITKAKRTAKLPPRYRATHTKFAINHLKHARYHLRMCGSKKAADAVARTIKSAEGALRHAKREDLISKLEGGL